jgi:hypothetical protein
MSLPNTAQNPESDWWVYSTAVAEGAILVENRSTGQRATVRDPSSEEWSAAFHAPSNPYRWLSPERLAINSLSDAAVELGSDTRAQHAL